MAYNKDNVISGNEIKNIRYTNIFHVSITFAHPSFCKKIEYGHPRTSLSDKRLLTAITS